MFSQWDIRKDVEFNASKTYLCLLSTNRKIDSQQLKMKGYLFWAYNLLKKNSVGTNIFLLSWKKRCHVKTGLVNKFETELSNLSGTLKSFVTLCRYCKEYCHAKPSQDLNISRSFVTSLKTTFSTEMATIIILLFSNHARTNIPHLLLLILLIYPTTSIRLQHPKGNVSAMTRITSLVN